MDEDRVAAMSAALLSLGERAAAGLGRGGLSQVHIHGESGGVWLLAAGDDAVLVGVSAADAKAGLVLYELRRAAAAVGTALAAEELAEFAERAVTAARAAGPQPTHAVPASSLPAQPAASAGAAAAGQSWPASGSGGWA
jgi:Roadblock/LC7 domain